MLDWLFIAPHPLWQWIGLFGGLTALGVAVMALPTVFQMIWGKPVVKVKLVVSLSRNKSDTKRYLVCKITNPPVKHWVLRMLGVYRRTADDVHALFHIEDAITHKMIASNVVAKIGTEWNITQMPSVSLPASKTPAVFTIVKVRTDGIATVTDSYGPQNFELLEGEYYIITTIYVSEKEINYRKKFYIGTKTEDLYLENKKA